VIFLLFGIFAGMHCEKEAMAPDEHEEEEEEGEEGGEVTKEEEEEEDEEEGENQLRYSEDKGENDKVSEEQLRKLHKTLDANKDGKVSTQEVIDHAAIVYGKVRNHEVGSMFDEIDSTKDGHMSLEEHIAEFDENYDGTPEGKELEKQHGIDKFHAADLNNDGKLDKDELTHLMHPDTHPEVLEIHAVEEMRKRDTNKDGKLSKDEWNVDATPGEHQAHNPDHEHDPEADFASLDEDKSGFISLDELRHWESGLFHSNDAINKLILLADKDHDGFLSENELAGIADDLEGHEALPHLLDMAIHDEEL